MCIRDSLDATQRPAPAMYLATTRRNAASKRRRPAAEGQQLLRIGSRLRLYHLQGPLMFASVEPVVRELMARAGEAEYFILNLRAVQSVDRTAARILARARTQLLAMDKVLVFAEVGAQYPALVDAGVERDAFFADDDFALEHGEQLLLARHYPGTVSAATVAVADCALFAGFDLDELTYLQRLLSLRTYHKGQTIIAAGHASDELFVITDGAAMVSIPTHDGIARLSAFATGMTFGEVGFLDHSPRSANITALVPVTCLVLSRATFAQLDRDAPAIKIKLLANLALGLTGMLRQANRELAVLK